ncbi:MAG: hypothetical protein H0X38_01650 [Planctomycetes bacterium]|nr:hypothetical protein [Planctomycetota bacterium]
MPQPRQRSTRPRGQGSANQRPAADDTERVRVLGAARGTHAIMAGAAALIGLGALGMWLLWGGQVQPLMKAVPSPSPSSAALTPAPAPAAPAPAVAALPPAATQPRTFVRGINLGGEGLTVDGHRWLAHAQALANGMELGAGAAIAVPAPITAAHLDFETKTMLDSGLAASGPVMLGQRLPNGAYEVSLWVAGAQGIDPALLVLRLDGDDVPIGKAVGAATWSRLGPYRVTVSQRRLAIAITGLGGAHLAGLAVAALGTGEATVPPVVTLTAPEAGAQLYGDEIVLLADVIPANGEIARVEFFDGRRRLGEALAPPYAYTWHGAPLGPHELSAVVSDRRAVQAGSGVVAMTVKPASDAPERVLERARGAMTRLGIEPTRLATDGTGLALDLNGSDIADLSWVKGLPLIALSLAKTRVTDLGVLTGMPLRRLDLGETHLRGYAFLKGLPLVELRMWGCDITDLAPLAGMPLEYLLLGHCAMTDLRPLAGLPLKHLFLQESAVTDLAPLAGMALVDLDVGATPVRDLAPLTGMPLTFLSIWNCPVTDLRPLAGMPLTNLTADGVKADFAPLHGMPLTYLSIVSTSIDDLAPLAGAPLRWLRMWSTKVSSLAPLTGMPLESLIMGYTPVTDLTPLSGMPLTEFDIIGCEQLRSLAPVATLAKLQKLSLPHLVPGIESLRHLPEGVRVRDGAHDQPVALADWFRDYDAAQHTGK